ncbi:metal ABC transporter substrate-binding protein [Sulfurimonas sp. C5]|uniref:metal ABC transporter substrate-binding protein n=1 Tax=Sulfurimonas sp. C5 TaxID=3036947 RepID=UPI00245647D5|nr:metal ABC transporter substrate-binding protein [Sulfurimonas sp. C5]MDH4944916.1 metal ABC transporter substrate-binding protein [Sulfurimonas sp. C5]
MALLSLVVVITIMTTGSNNEKLSSKPLVTTSNFAIYDVLKHIGGDKIELVNILPFGVDPHSFEPTPKGIAKLEKSKLFFYSGAILEPWTENIKSEVKSVDVSQYVSLKEFDEEDEHQHEEHHEHDHHGAYDPHYWLDVDNMKQIAQAVTEKLSILNPKNKHLFEKNEKNYIASLEELDNLYKQKLLSCKLDTIVVTHNAFEYLAQRYGFQVESLTGLSTEEQPSAQDVKRIFQEIQERNIQMVFFENFSSQKNIQTIADDLGIKVENLQPLGNITAEELDQNLTYVDIMKNNLEKIAKAMQCN